MRRCLRNHSRSLRVSSLAVGACLWLAVDMCAFVRCVRGGTLFLTEWMLIGLPATSSHRGRIGKLTTEAAFRETRSRAELMVYEGVEEKIREFFTIADNLDWY